MEIYEILDIILFIICFIIYFYPVYDVCSTIIKKKHSIVLGKRIKIKEMNILPDNNDRIMIENLEYQVALALQWPRIYFVTGRLIPGNQETLQFSYASHLSFGINNHHIAIECWIPYLENKEQRNHVAAQFFFLEPDIETIDIESNNALIFTVGKENIYRVKLLNSMLVCYFAAGGNYLPWLKGKQNYVGLVPTKTMEINIQL